MSLSITEFEECEEIIVTFFLDFYKWKEMLSWEYIVIHTCPEIKIRERLGYNFVDAFLVRYDTRNYFDLD